MKTFFKRWALGYVPLFAVQVGVIVAVTKSEFRHTDVFWAMVVVSHIAAVLLSAALAVLTLHKETNR